MKKFCYTLVSLLSVSFFVFTANAQTGDNNTANHSVAITIPEVALLDIESSTSSAITLEAKHSGEAGDPITFAGVTNSDLWLNYSSIVSTTNTARKVTAQITSGAVPAGVQLKVVAGSSVSGGGTRGSAAASGVVLSTSPQDLITGIGSSYTETGVNKGHQLTYSLSLVDDANYANLRFDQTNTVQVTYTIINQ